MKPARHIIACVAIVVLALLIYQGVSLSGLVRGTRARTPLAIPLEQLPLTLGQWKGRDIPLPEKVVELAGASSYINRDYFSPDGARVNLYIAYYDHVMERVPHGPTICMPYHGWEKHQDQIVTLPERIPGYEKLVAKKLLYERDLSQMALFYWYSANGRQLVGEREMHAGSAWQKFKMLFGLGGGYLIQVSVASPVIDSQQAAFDRAENFFRQNIPVIARHFPKLKQNSNEENTNEPTQ